LPRPSHASLIPPPVESHAVCMVKIFHDPAAVAGTYGPDWPAHKHAHTHTRTHDHSADAIDPSGARLVSLGQTGIQVRSHFASSHRLSLCLPIGGGHQETCTPVRIVVTNNVTSVAPGHPIHSSTPSPGGNTAAGRCVPTRSCNGIPCGGSCSKATSCRRASNKNLLYIISNVYLATY
jgi:hypothetical protein